MSDKDVEEITLQNIILGRVPPMVSSEIVLRMAKEIIRRRRVEECRKELDASFEQRNKVEGE